MTNREYEEMKKATRQVIESRNIEPFINKEMELLEYSLLYGVDTIDIDFKRVNRKIKEYAADTRYNVKSLEMFYIPFMGGLIAGKIEYRNIKYNYLYSVNDNIINLKEF